MSVARVTEITSSSEKSFQDAIELGIARAVRTLKNVEGAWIQDHKIDVEDTAVAVLEFESGALATLEATTAAFPGYPRRIELSG